MEIAVGSIFDCSKPKRYQLMCLSFFSFSIVTVIISFSVFRNLSGNMLTNKKRFIRDAVRKIVVTENIAENHY